MNLKFIYFFLSTDTRKCWNT